MDERTSSEPAGELLHICQRSVAETGSQICLLFPLKFVVFDLRRTGFLFRCVTWCFRPMWSSHHVVQCLGVTSCDYYKHTESQLPGRDDNRPHDLLSLVTPQPHGVHCCGLSCVLWLCRRMFAARTAAWFHYHSGSSRISLRSCRGQWERCQIIQILIRKPLQCNFLLLVLFSLRLRLIMKQICNICRDAPAQRFCSWYRF